MTPPVPFDGFQTWLEARVTVDRLILECLTSGDKFQDVMADLLLAVQQAAENKAKSTQPCP